MDNYHAACEPGDYWLDEHNAGLTFICPRCQRLGGVRFGGRGWTWDNNTDMPTVQPSILHDSPRCGWHGYLTAGYFVEC